MKKIFFLLLLTGISVNCFNQVANPAATTELKWYSWNEGYTKAKAENKILLVDIYTDWCGWCKKWIKTPIQNPKLSKSLINILLRLNLTLKSGMWFTILMVQR